MDFRKLSIKELVGHLQAGDLSCEKWVETLLTHGKNEDKKYNCVLRFYDSALEDARQYDLLPEKEKKQKKLFGLPFMLKDQFCAQGYPVSAGSKMLENFISPYSSHAVESLWREGALLIGHNNQDEFAMGSSTETSHYGPSKNPWDVNRVCGGSSGGSAGAVAAHLTPLSLGTDTGGSIRQPAHFCNVFGLKPTYGRVSRYGVIAYASSLDQPGPITKSVQDSAFILETIAGKDLRDGTSSTQPVDAWSSKMSSDLRGRRFVKLRDEEVSPYVCPQTQRALQKAEEFLKDAGATVREVSLAELKLSVSTYYLIACSEASSNLSRYDGVRYGHRAASSDSLSTENFYSQNRSEGFGKEVQRRILMGTFCLSSGYYEAYYQKASQVRRLLQQKLFEILKEGDVFLLPVSPSKAFFLGEKTKDPLALYQEDLFTTLANLTGVPAVSVPTIKEDLPLGVQLLAQPFDEQSLFNFSLAIEERRGFEGGLRES